MVGKILDLVIEKRPFRRYLVIPFLLLSSGLILWGTSFFILSRSEAFGFPPEAAFEYLLMSIAGAVLIAVVIILPLTRRS